MTTRDLDIDLQLRQKAQNTDASNEVKAVVKRVLLDISFQSPTSEYLADFKKLQDTAKSTEEFIVLATKLLFQYQDEVLVKYSNKFDGTSVKTIENLKVTEEEFLAATVTDELKKAINTAVKNLTQYHEAQVPKGFTIENKQGMMLARRYVPIQNIGLYVPGGTASLVSTLMMMLVPAKIAGNPNVIVCTPPNKGFKIDSAILYICRLFGVKNIYKIGGAQAIGLMAYGSSVTPKCNKIFGPGNAFVTEAKKYIAANTSCAIDMPAGPSEVFVIGDETANAEFIASDLLSQAEHDVNARAICISHSQKLLHEVNIAVAEQMKSLSRKTILGFSNIVFINTKSIEESLEYSNREAPEHLILSVKDPEQYLDKIVNAGSIFLGNYTPESLGDYTSGTNHVLPTNGCAAGYSGLGLDAFYKSISVQKADKEVLQKIADDTITLANHEGLDAHANAIKIRCKN